MSEDNAERALKEAEGWLAAAKHTLVESHDDEALANVCCAQSIHSIIRANDALSLKFFGIKATRHDDAAAIFAKLLREGKLLAADGEFKNLISRAMRDKSGADYGKKVFSLEEAAEYAQKAEEFIARAKTYLENA